MTPPETVLLLPGLLCDATVWQAQRQMLGATPCVVPDYGHIDSLAGMAEQVLREVPAGALSIAGHSMGGRVALEIARLAPGRVRRIALLDTGMLPRPADATGAAEQAQRLALLQLARERGMREMARQWARGMVHPAQIGQPVFEAILDMIESKTPALYEAQIRALLNRPDARAVLQGLRCPTLFLCGRQDLWSPLDRHQQMQALVPGSELVVVEDAGHMTTMEQPAAVSEALRRWLQT